MPRRKKVNKEERNIVLSAYEKVLSDYNNLISIVGGTTDGLYDIDDEYIFRGLNPNNCNYIDYYFHCIVF